MTINFVKTLYLPAFQALRAAVLIKSPCRVRFRANLTLSRHRRMTESDPMRAITSARFRTAAST
jgi:hypothetical protein